MKKIYVKFNFVLVEIDGVRVREFSSTGAELSTIEDSWVLYSTKGPTNDFYIPKADVGAWYNEAGDTPYNETTLDDFLLSNLGKSSGTSEGGGDVSSVFGRTGEVVAQQTDYSSYYLAKALQEKHVYVGNESTEGAPHPFHQEFLVDSLVTIAQGVWVLAQEFPLNEAVNVAPFTSGTGWDTKSVSLSIESGSLPSGVALITDSEDANWSHIVGTATSAGSGTTTIRCTNPKGDYDYVLNWAVSEPQGRAEFFNTLHPYASFRSAIYDFLDINLAYVEGLTGQINSSYVFDDSDNSQVYYHEYTEPSEGYSYSYLMQHATSSYWYLFKSNVAPELVVNGLDLADSLTSTGYELASSDSNEVTVGGIKYPVSLDIEWLTSQNYVNVGNNTTLNGFLSNNNAWSYGFRVDQDIPADFLGRPMFTRAGGNYYGFKFLSSTYGYVIYGRALGDNSYSSDDTDIGAISQGDWVHLTFDGSGDLNFYVNGNLKANDTFAYIYFNSDVLSNGQDVLFGKCVASNEDQGSSTQYEGMSYFQGLIADGYIANGVEFTPAQLSEISGQTDITASTNYGSVTHAWRFDETTGSIFTALKGGLNASGEKTT